MFNLKTIIIKFYYKYILLTLIIKKNSTIVLFNIVKLQNANDKINNNIEFRKISLFLVESS